MFSEPSYPLIIPVIILYFSVLMGVAPLSYQIHIEQACEAIQSDDCDDSEVSARASNLSFIAAFAHYIPAIFTCGIYGNVADIYGRKRALIFPIFGLAAWATGYFIVTTYNPSYYFYIIIAANFCLGFSGSYMSFLMASLCYVADCTAHITATRKRAYSVTEASIFAAQIFCPVITGIWANYYGFTLPFLCGIIFAGFAGIYTLFIPESLPIDALSRKKKFEIDVFQTFRNLYFIFQYKCPQGSSPLPWVGMAFFSFFMVTIGYGTVKIVYVKHRYGWDSATIGIFDGLEGFLIMVSMLLAPAIFKKYTSLNLKIITWIQIGYFFRTLYFVLFALVPSTVYIFLIVPCLLMVGPLAPYNRTIISNSVTLDKQAQAFTAFSAIEGVSALFAPLFSALYSIFVVANFGAVIFYIMAFFVGVSFFMIYYIKSNKDLRRNLPEESYISENIKNDSSLSIRNISAISVSVERDLNSEQTKNLLSDFNAIDENIDENNGDDDGNGHYHH